MGTLSESESSAGLVCDGSPPGPFPPVHYRRTLDHGRKPDGATNACGQGETSVDPYPSVSVVMPVWIRARYLDVSIGSLVGKTFRHFELVIADDGSTGGTWEILGRWASRDARIRLARSSRRLGPVGPSNLVARAGVVETPVSSAGPGFRPGPDRRCDEQVSRGRLVEHPRFRDPYRSTRLDPREPPRPRVGRDC